jgi:hypothetical protein
VAEDYHFPSLQEIDAWERENNSEAYEGAIEIQRKREEKRKADESAARAEAQAKLAACTKCDKKFCTTLCEKP